MGNGDMTGKDPLSSAAEGDQDPGTAALAGAGVDAADGEPVDPAPVTGPPPEAADETPVTDAVPDTYVGSAPD